MPAAKVPPRPCACSTVFIGRHRCLQTQTLDASQASPKLMCLQHSFYWRASMPAVSNPECQPSLPQVDVPAAQFLLAGIDACRFNPGLQPSFPQVDVPAAQFLPAGIDACSQGPPKAMCLQHSFYQQAPMPAGPSQNRCACSTVVTSRHRCLQPKPPNTDVLAAQFLPTGIDACSQGPPPTMLPQHNYYQQASTPAATKHY